jgi:hypothetical protein
VRTPTFADLRKFLAVDGEWIELPRQGSKRHRDHYRYAKVLSDGTTLYTRISQGAGSIDDHDLFKLILRDQLGVTEFEFWAAVDGGHPPSRASERVRPEQPTLPHWLVSNLTRKAGLSVSDVMATSEEQARAAWDDWTSRPH